MELKEKLLYNIHAYTYTSVDAPSNAIQRFKKKEKLINKFFSRFFVGTSIFYDAKTNQSIGAGNLIANPWFIKDDPKNEDHNLNVTKYDQGVQTITLNETSSRPQILIPLFSIVNPSLTKKQLIYTQDVYGRLTIIKVTNNVPNDTGYKRQNLNIKIYDLPFYTKPSIPVNN